MNHEDHATSSRHQGHRDPLRGLRRSRRVGHLPQGHPRARGDRRPLQPLGGPDAHGRRRTGEEAMKRFLGLCALALSASAAGFCVVLAACTGLGTPSPTDQKAVVTYAASLQACIAQAKLTEGTVADYEKCAHKVDAQWGVPEGGM